MYAVVFRLQDNLLNILRRLTIAYRNAVSRYSRLGMLSLLKVLKLKKLLCCLVMLNKFPMRVVVFVRMAGNR